MLHLAEGLDLPLELATQSIAVLAVKGAGKTYAASVFAEELIAAGVQVVAIDPTDAWWGLRSSADGTKDGLPVYVFGGAHADVPLEATAGELIADVVVDSGMNAILSLRHLSKGDQHRFVTAFALRLYHRKGEADKRTPVHLFIDEAHAFAPQMVQGETARMVGAIEDLIRMGRSSGIGATLISQRPAAVNKNVLTQCETLLCLRLIHPRDRKAVEEWIEVHDAENRRAEFMASLASFQNGEAWAWSPPLGLFERIRIRKRHTFDSSATPKIGEAPIEPRRLTPVDVEALGQHITETVERQKANDPRLLKAEIARLAREKVTLLADVDAARAEIERLERAIEDGPSAEGWEAEISDLRGQLDALKAQNAEWWAWAGSMPPLVNVPEIRRVARSLPPLVDAPEIRREVREAAGVPKRSASLPVRGAVEVAQRRESGGRETKAPQSDPAASTVSLGKAERAILTVLAQYTERSKRQLATLAGYAIGGGGFNNALSALRSKALIEGRDDLRITEGGQAAIAGQWEPLPTGPDLAEHWYARLPKAEKSILRELITLHPGEAAKAQVAEWTGYEVSGGGFNNALGHLRTLELIDGGTREQPMLRASDAFFD